MYSTKTKFVIGTQSLIKLSNHSYAKGKQMKSLEAEQMKGKNSNKKTIAAIVKGETVYDLRSRIRGTEVSSLERKRYLKSVR